MEMVVMMVACDKAEGGVKVVAGGGDSERGSVCGEGGDDGVHDADGGDDSGVGSRHGGGGGGGSDGGGAEHETGRLTRW